MQSKEEIRDLKKKKESLNPLPLKRYDETVTESENNDTIISHEPRNYNGRFNLFNR